MYQRMLSLVAVAAIFLLGTACQQPKVESLSAPSAASSSAPAQSDTEDPSSSAPLPLSSARPQTSSSESPTPLNTKEIGSDTVVLYSDVRGLYGLADKATQEIILPAEYGRIDPFSEGLAAAKRGNRFYYLDEQGNVALALEESVTEAQPFEEGIACLWVNPPQELIYTVPFSIKVGGPSYFICIDKTGQVVVPYSIQGGWRFSWGTPLAEKYKSTIWSDRGTLLTQVIEQDSELCVLNRQGEYLQKKIGQAYGDFSEGLLLTMKDEKWGYLNEYGEVVIDFQFEEADDFSDGLACVRMGDKYGFIDRRGEVVIPAQYAFPSAFENGYAQVYPTYFQTCLQAYANQYSSMALGYIFGEPGANSSRFYTYHIIDTAGNVVYRQDQLLRSSSGSFVSEYQNEGAYMAYSLAGIAPQTYWLDDYLVMDYSLSMRNAIEENERWKITSPYPPVQAIDIAHVPHVLVPLEESPAAP